MIPGSPEEKLAFRDEIATLLHISAQQVENVFPITPFQEAVMASSFEQPGAFMLQEVVEITSDISIDRFRGAWDRAVEIMPILRTRICESSRLSGYFQTVLIEEAKWQVCYGHIDSFLKHDIEKPMKLEQPLSRLAFVHDTSNSKSYFAWTISHCIYDGVSISLI